MAINFNTCSMFHVLALGNHLMLYSKGVHSLLIHTSVRALSKLVKLVEHSSAH